MWQDKRAMRSEKENEFYDTEFNNQIVHKPAGALTGRLCEEALRGDVDESTIYNAIQDFFAEFPFAKVFVYTDNEGEARTLYRTEQGDWALEPITLTPAQEKELMNAKLTAMAKSLGVSTTGKPKKARKKKAPKAPTVPKEPEIEKVEGETLLGHFVTMQGRFKQGGYMMYQRKKIF